MLRTIWDEEGRIFIIDQTLLPGKLEITEIETVEEMWDAVKHLRVRGAPAIGIAAAYGIWLAVRDLDESDNYYSIARDACRYITTARPTAVNPFWASDRMAALIAKQKEQDADLENLKQAILEEAQTIVDEDLTVCRSIGKFGASLLNDGDNVLTHCNAGGLATAGVGTALAPIYWSVKEEGKNIHIYVDETRPLLQGARLTAWELQQAEIPTTLICDNMAAMLMKQDRVQAVIVGTDRVTANGDMANKIGTYGLAILARYHGVPFYVAAPISSIDLKLPNGQFIPIEERDPDEVRYFGKQLVAPADINVYNPSFDVTPAELITALITERGVISRPFPERLRALAAEEPEQ